MAATPDDNRDRLAEKVKQRRLGLGLSAPKAAIRAKVSRQTWLNLEAGTHKPNPSNHAGIERALGWTPGSVEAILAAGEPTIGSAITDPGRPSLAELIRQVNDLPLSAGEKLDAIHALIDSYRTIDPLANPDVTNGPDTRTG